MKFRAVAVAATAMLLAGCASGAAEPTPADTGLLSFGDAIARCGVGPTTFLDVQDSGDSLVIDTQGDEDSAGTSIKTAKCVLGKLEMPDAVWAAMEQTRALDGRQSDSWDGVEASWSYHPDTGLNVILTRG